MKCRVHQNVMKRWILLHPELDDAAWSGNSWVEINKFGFGTIVQVCNFDTEDDAYQYALSHGFTRITVNFS